MNTQEYQDLIRYGTPDDTPVDPMVAGGGLTPELAYGMQQSLMPLLLKKVLEDDSTDFGSYNPAGYYIPNSPERVQGKRAQRQQALEMLRGLMKDIRGAGAGGLAGGLNPNKVYQMNPGDTLTVWNPQTRQFERAPGQSSVPYGPKAINGKEVIHNADGSVSINDLRTTPAEASRLEEGKESPGWIKTDLENIQKEEEVVFQTQQSARTIIAAVQNPRVRALMGTGASPKMFVEGLAAALNPDAPAEALTQAQMLYSQLMDVAANKIKLFSPASDKDVEIAARASVGDMSWTPDAILGVAQRALERADATADVLDERRRSAETHPYAGEIPKIYPRVRQIGRKKEEVIPAAPAAPAAPSFEEWLRAKGHIK